MTADFTNIRVGANGSVYVAPLAAVMPTTSDPADLSGDWLDLGTISEDGATFTKTPTLIEIGAWQSAYPARRIVTTLEATLAFICREWKKDVVEFAMGSTIAGGGGLQEVQSVQIVGFVANTDSYHLSYGGNESAIITFGDNDTPAGIKAAIEGISGVTFTVEISDYSAEGYLVTFADQVDRTPLTVTNGGGGVTGTVATLIDGAAPAGDDYIATPTGSDTIDERAVAVYWNDGSSDNGILMPRGMVSGTTTVQMFRTGAVDIPIEFSATPQAGDDPFRWLSNEPAWA